MIQEKLREAFPPPPPKAMRATARTLPPRTGRPMRAPKRMRPVKQGPTALPTIEAVREQSNLVRAHIEGGRIEAMHSKAPRVVKRGRQ